MADSSNKQWDVVCTENSAAKGAVVLLCEHASAEIPSEYSGLGLAPEDRLSHAAWDPGAADLTRALAARLQAAAVLGQISRLVYDCNRPPEVASAMPVQSETILVPGNHDLSNDERARRTQMVYEPFCAAVDQVLAARPDAVLLTVHSFTPVYFGRAREVEIGVLHDVDTRLADALLAHPVSGFHIARNQPYGPQDGVTHSLKRHAIARGLPNAMIEVRNDLLADAAGVERVAVALQHMIEAALAQMAEGDDA